MLRTAEDSLQKAKTFTQRGQLDLALDEYVRASEITINGIPGHHDFAYMNRQHPRWSDRFSALLMVRIHFTKLSRVPERKFDQYGLTGYKGVNSQHGTMEAIKQKIAASNNVATSRSRPSSRIERRSSSPEQSHNSQTPACARNSVTMELPLRMPSPSNFQTSPPGSPKFMAHQPSSPRWATSVPG